MSSFAHLAGLVSDQRLQSLSLRKLSFPGELETEFAQHYAEESPGYVRNALGLGMFLMVLNSALTFLDGGDRAWRLGMLDLLICGLGLLCVLIASSRIRTQATHLAAAVFVLVSAAGYGFYAWTNAVHLESANSYLMLFVLGSYTLLRFRFLEALIVGTFVTLLAVLVADAAPPDPLGVGEQAKLTFIKMATMANLIGMVACVYQERSARKDFITGRMLDEERTRSDRLLDSILPPSISERLKSGESFIADAYEDATVLIADIVDFTGFSARTAPEEVVRVLNDLYSAFDRAAEAYGVEKIKTIGDCYLAACGMHRGPANHAEAVVAMAIDMLKAAEQVAQEWSIALQVRVGIHTGPLAGGIVGKTKYVYDLWGDTVNVASRMESMSAPGRIQLSEESCNRLGGRFRTEPRGLIEVKGRGPMPSFFLIEDSAEPAVASVGV